MNLIKKIVSLSYNKKISPFHILKECKKLLVLFPINEIETNYLFPAVKLLAKKFNKQPIEIIGVIKKNSADIIIYEKLFSNIIEYKKIPKLWTKQFFALKRKLREINASVSIDFNTKNDILTWLGGASLRIGVLNSPFINYRIKVDVNEKNFPIKLIESICIPD